MKYGVMQDVLNLSGRDLFERARSIGFEGVELNALSEDHEIFSPTGIANIKDSISQTGIMVPSIGLGLLNFFGFKSEEEQLRQKAHELILKTISVAVDVGATTILIPFFGPSEISGSRDMDKVRLGMSEVSRAAEDAGVVLAMENTLSAKENLSLLADIGSESVKIYFDVSNSVWWGHDAPDEIRSLGDAIAQIHFKDGRGDHSNEMLGRGHVPFPQVVDAMEEISYDGWIVLETVCPTDIVEDTRGNLEYSKRVIGRFDR